jgi:hypothetical protein
MHFTGLSLAFAFLSAALAAAAPSIEDTVVSRGQVCTNAHAISSSHQKLINLSQKQIPIPLFCEVLGGVSKREVSIANFGIDNCI